MTSTRLLSLVSAFVAVALTILLLINSTEKADAAVVDGTALPIPTPATDGSKTGKVTTSGGLTTVTFEPAPGTVRVYLPDDMRAGDTISGTLVAEPKGQTEEERAKNLAGLNGHTIMIWPRPVPGPAQTGDGGIKLPVKDPAFTFTLPPPTAADRPPPAFIRIGVADSSGRPGDFVQDNFTFLYGGNLLDPVVKDFGLPPLGQQGRPLEIFGPFDGNSSNTTLRFGPPGSTVQDFEKNTENVSGGFGLITTLVESPRRLLFESPSNVTGPVTILVKEGGGAPTTGTMRNLGVRLTAPKTSLLKGEKTTLTIQVTGLEGIQKPVPLTLTSEGVITMEGGPYQPLMIQPSQVDAGGRYSTTRGVTGIQAGGWGATATVVTDRFNMRLQDDNDPNRLFHFNSFTGDYIFACGGGSCRTGGTGGTSSEPPTGSSAPPPVTLTGIGKPAMKGCIITLSHNAPDRRVFARLDACTKTGDASVETKSPKANINITDKNTADNTTSSPPK